MTIRKFRDEIRTKLADGTPVLLRQVLPEDKQIMEIGMSQLSRTSKQMRFFSAMPSLPQHLLEKLTEVDHFDHDAWTAIDMSTEPPTPIAVARYVRLKDDRAAAEPAVTVIDKYHGRGVGTLLLAIIACRALENGINRFVAYVLYENTQMLSIFKELGGETKYLGEGELEVSAPLHRKPKRYAKTPAGKVFRKVAERIYNWD